ncbi:hypothetical protein BST12_16920 [Mycobacterium angelicum]|uniref:Lipoprotein LpqS n=1 Tax=Mycobacterium angelicum TaxID=470074 RepID=A0A1W9ZNS5_MYCAN|nr:hypothetical protein BST12_16920 [Mycobacterium angelicum]
MVAWLVFGIAGVHCGIPRLDLGHIQHADSSLSAVAGDQGHLLGPAKPCPPRFATLPLPPPVTAWVALGLVAVAGVAAFLVACVGAPGGRSPPAGVVVAVSGRSLLTRICQVRR